MSKVNGQRSNVKGFTLIEVLIYTALIGVAGVFLNSTLISVLKLQGQQSASTVVNQQINFVLQNIQKSVRESSLIEMEGNVASTTMKLRMKDLVLDPTLIYLSGTTVYIKKGAAAALALTTAEVNADQLNFTKVSSYPGHDSVSVDISFSYNTNNPQHAFTKTINSAISRVSGATFDSDILPGADATYSVGSVANRWQNLTLSGDLTVAGNSSFTGNVGIGTAIPGAGLHINTSAGTTAFKVGSTTAQFIINSSGNIGIGNSAPAAKLDIQTTGNTGNQVRITDTEGASAALRTYSASDADGLLINNYYAVAGSPYLRSADFVANQSSADTQMRFFTKRAAGNPVLAMTINSSGNVGIGTATQAPLGGAAGKLFVTGSGDTSILVQGGTGGAIETGIRSVLTQGQVGTFTNHPFNLVQNGNPILSVISSGYVGIGTTSPAQTLSVAGTIYSSTGGFRFPDGTTQTTAGGGSTVQAPTRQVFTSGSGTYTKPAGVGLIKVRMVGGGGGGGAGATNAGTAGNNTTFSTLTASGGSAGPAGAGGQSNPVAGGAGGAASGCDINITGGGGGGGQPYGGSKGGDSAFGGGALGSAVAAAGGAGTTNSGGGGGGGSANTSSAGGGGGGAGGYCEKIITNPTATYSYSVGASAAGGAAGTFAGGAGGSGVIIVDEYYTTALSVDVTSGGNNTFTGTNAFTNGITGMWSTVSSQTVSGVSSITFSDLAVATTYRLVATLTPTSSNTAATWYFRINNVSTASYLYGGNYAVSAAATGGLGSTAATGCPFQLSTGTMTAGADVTNLTTEPFRSSPANSARQIITYSAGSTYGNEGAIMSEKMTCYAKVGIMTSITIVPPVTASGWVALEKLN